MHPNPGETIGLQLEHHRQSVGIPRGGSPLRGLHSFADAEHVLNVVADFVRTDIRLREVAGCTDTVLQITIECEVYVDLGIEGGVKRPPPRRFAFALEDEDLDRVTWT